MRKYLFILTLCISLNGQIFASASNLNGEGTSTLCNSLRSKSKLIVKVSKTTENHTVINRFNDSSKHHESDISPWIKKKGDVFVYKFNVFNLAPNDVSMHDLKAMMKANEKDTWKKL